MIKQRLLLADDYPVIRYWLHDHLAETFDIVGQARTGDELFSLAQSTRPHLIIFDLLMPGLNTLIAAKKILAEWPKTRLIVVTYRDDLPTVRRVFANGVRGYVLKSAPDELSAAITDVLAGRRYLAKELAEEIPLHSLDIESPIQGASSVTTRQQELLQLIAQGLCNDAIAHKMCVSVSTIEHARCTLKRQYGLKNKSDFIKLAIQEGLIST
jgi:DNA-binding NarL/FixJ family response regulator